MNISNRIARQPLSQIDINQEDVRGTTPTHKQLTSVTLNSDYKNNQNYNVQFKVGANKVTNSSRLNENNNAFMSPMPLRRNTQFQIQQQQQIRSPLQKNYSQAHISPVPNSPKPTLKFREASQQPQVISHTTTQQLQSEIQFLREQNTKLQQSVFKLESEIQRGTSTSFIKELENKINMLKTLNDKLHYDNSQLVRISDVQQLKKECAEQNQNMIALESQYEEIVSQFDKYDCDQFQENDQASKINNLVADLEQKISGLIKENEQLNAQAQQQQKLTQEIEQLQLDVQSQQIAYQKSKHDEVQFRFKYDQTLHEEKVVQKNNKKVNPNIENLKEKIKVLEEENEKLRNLITSEDFDEEISDLEDRIRVIAQDNKKLEQQLLKIE